MDECNQNHGFRLFSLTGAKGGEHERCNYWLSNNNIERGSFGSVIRNMRTHNSVFLFLFYFKYLEDHRCLYLNC